MNPIRKAVGEMMLGKQVSEPIQGFWFGINRMFGRGVMNEIKYERNNYDLYQSMYMNSVIDGKGRDFAIAAALAKPVINITAGFVIGRGFRITLDNPLRSEEIQAAEDFLNKWREEKAEKFYDLAKFSYRDGDAYLHIDELGEMTTLDPRGVEPIREPVTQRLIGFDVTTKLQIKEQFIPGVTSANPKPETYIYVKQYRTDSIRIFRYKAGDTDKPELIWEKIFTQNGVQDVNRNPEGDVVGITADDVMERPLAVKHYANEPEPQDQYGNSDLQNILLLLREYSDVIQASKKNVIYNSTPVPVLKGVKKKDKLENGEDANKDGKGTPEWGSDKIIYLDGDKADAKMLQASAVMDDAQKLLEIYFYLIVQGTETPEFAFGTAVSSSKASTETQLPVLTQKVERKQQELKHVLKEIVETYMERRIALGDPNFLIFRGQVPSVSISFPPISDDDKKLTLDTVTWAHENGLLQGQTALELILGDKVKDVSDEFKAAAAEAKKKADEAAPAQQDRLVKQLLANQPGATPAPAPVGDTSGNQG